MDPVPYSKLPRLCFQGFVHRFASEADITRPILPREFDHSQEHLAIFPRQIGADMQKKRRPRLKSTLAQNRESLRFLDSLEIRVQRVVGHDPSGLGTAHVRDLAKMPSGQMG